MAQRTHACGEISEQHVGQQDNIKRMGTTSSRLRWTNLR